MTLQVSLLGGLRVELDGRPIQVDTRKALALLAYLALQDEPQARATLAGLLWSDYDDANARAALRRTLSVLNRALEGRGLVIGRDAVHLDPGAVQLDVRSSRALVRRCGEHGHPAREVCLQCLAPLTDAAALHRGDFLSGFAVRDAPEFEAWQASQAEALRRELDAVLSRLVRACVEARRLDDAIDHARRRLDIDPLNEAAHRTLMSLYALTGDRAASLRQYRDCVRVLESELGVQPLGETTALYQAILADEGQAEVLPAPAPVPEAARRAQPAALAFAGRDAELRELSDALAGLDRGACSVFIEGEAGVGKTRLVRELSDLVSNRGGACLAAQCYEGETDLAFGPIVMLLQQALRTPGVAARLGGLAASSLVELSRLVALPPELAAGLPSAPALDSPAGQARFFAALEQCLTAASDVTEPCLIVLEDLHWADEASLDFVAYLSRRLTGRRLLTLTWRSDELPPAHRLQRLLLERQSAGAALHLSLGRLDLDAVQRIVTAFYGGGHDDLAHRLYEETEGLPFFLAQYLSANPDASAETWQTPSGIGDLLRSRIGRLSDLERQLLSAAAVIGRAFSFDLLREVGGRADEDTLTGLEGLARQGLLQVAQASGESNPYDFTHQKLRVFAYEETGPARRQLLHRRAGEALLHAAGRRLGEVAAQAGSHFRAAGQHQRAAECFMAAGAQARSVRALAESLSHYEAALSCGYEPAAETHRRIAELYTLSGAYGPALASYQTAAALSDAETLPEVEHKIGGIYLRLGSWRLAEEHLNAAIAGFTTLGRPGDRARAQSDLALIAHRQGASGDGMSLALEALRLAEAGEDRMASAQAENILGILVGGQGDLDAAVRHFESSLALADELGAEEARVAVLNNLSLAQRRGGRLDEAEAAANAALDACLRLGDRHHEAAIRNNLADLLRDAGRNEESMTQLKLAVALFAEVSNDSSHPEPEIWKLVEW